MRKRELKFRVNDDEYNRILERNTKPRLADWLRSLALREPIIPISKTADPKLLFALSRIGGNINQIAKACNSNRVDKYKSVEILLQLEKIEKELSNILLNNS